MRARIIFSLLNKGAVLPFHHQGHLENMVNNLFIDCPVFGLHKPNFCFSSLKGQTKVLKTGLCFFSAKVTLVFSSTNDAFAQSFFSILLKRNIISLGGLSIIAEQVIYEKMPDFEQHGKFICLSPVVIANKKMMLTPLVAKAFVSPEQDYFSDLLYENTMSCMESSGLFSINKLEEFYKFQVLPDEDYLGKIKSEEKKFARIYSSCLDGAAIEFRGYTMPFTLYAHPLVLKFVFENGLGEFGSKGYGMLDLANQSFTNRVQKEVINQEDIIKSKRVNVIIPSQTQI